jgi:hypothetical protein
MFWVLCMATGSPGGSSRSAGIYALNQELCIRLLKLEQEGSIASEWGASENNRKARFYRLTREGRKQLAPIPANGNRPRPSSGDFLRCEGKI